MEEVNACWCALPALTGSTECCKNCKKGKGSYTTTNTTEELKYKTSYASTDPNDKGEVITVDPMKFEEDYGIAYINGPSTISHGTACLICGEVVDLNYMDQSPKICEKCRKAVMKIRGEIEE